MVTFTGKSTIGVSQTTNAGTTSNDGDQEIIDALAQVRHETIDATNAFTITNIASTYLWERNATWRFTDAGSPPAAQITVTVPATPERGRFGVINATSQPMAVTIAAQPLTAPVIAAGEAAVLSSDGTNVELLSSVGAGGGTLESLTDVDTLAGVPDGYVLARKTGPAAEWVPQSAGAGDALPFVLSPTWRGATYKIDADKLTQDFDPGAKVPWDSVVRDIGGFDDVINDQFLVPAGVTKVAVTGQVTFEGFAGSQVLLEIFKNGVNTTPQRALTRWDPVVSVVSWPVFLPHLDVVEGDTIDLQLTTVGDSSITLSTSDTWFHIEVLETTDTVPSLRSVVVSLPAKRRYARISKTAAQTSIGLGVVEVTFDEVVTDTDGIADLTNNALVVPAGVSKVRVYGMTQVVNATTGTSLLSHIQKNDADIDAKGEGLVRFGLGSNDDYEIQASTPIIDVAQGDSFTIGLQIVGDATADITTITWFEMEIVEFNSSTDAVQAYIAIPPEHKGALLAIGAGQSTASGVAENIAWTSATEDTSFDPGDGGPPQRFWLGANWTFVDGDVTVGSDQITETAHGYQTGEGPVRLTSSGTLPAGLALNTNYWIIRVDANELKFATSRANALAGTAVDITAAAGGGTHTVDQEEYIVIPAGVARIDLSASIDWAASVTGSRTIQIVSRDPSDAPVNTPGTAAEVYLPSNSAITGMAVANGLSVSEGDRFVVSVLQTAGTFDVDATQHTWFSVRVAEESRAITYPGVTVTPPWRGASVYLNANQTLTNGMLTKIVYDTTVNDTDSIWDGTNFRMVVPAGVTKIQVRANIFYASGTNFRSQYFQKNGAVFDLAGRIDDNITTATNRGYWIESGTIDVVAGDYFEAYAQQSSGGILDLIAGSHTNSFEMEIVETNEAAFPPEPLKAHITAADKLVISSTVAMWLADNRLSLADDFTGSLGYAIAGPNGGAVVYDVQVEGVSIGSMTFADSTGAAQTATFSTTASAVEVINVGERLEIIAPANIQSMDDVAFTILAWRS